jgi:signal peptidase
MRVLARIAHATLWVAAVLCIGLFAVVAVGPRTGRFQVITVLTGSMAPNAPRGSLAIVEPKPLDQLRVGDVLTYAIPVEDHHVVTHRVIELRRTAGATVVRTKGDANDAADPWVAELHDATVWTERVALPHVGQAVVALRDPLVRRLGQLAPLLLVVGFLRHLWRKEEVAPDAVVA